MVVIVKKKQIGVFGLFCSLSTWVQEETTLKEGYMCTRVVHLGVVVLVLVAENIIVLFDVVCRTSRYSILATAVD